MECDDSAPCYVTAEEGNLRQVLVNLLGYVVKFTKKGGFAVRVRSEDIVGKNVTENKVLRLVVDVEDSGLVIAAEDTGMIFDAFQQAATGVKTGGGTGVGLAICRMFVEMMGGKLTVMSQFGKGSCFRPEARLVSAREIAILEKPDSRRVISLEPGA